MKPHLAWLVQVKSLVDLKAVDKLGPDNGWADGCSEGN
jgi:hypothetical protein